MGLFASRTEWIKNEEGENWEDAARKRGSYKSDDLHYRKTEKEIDTSGDEENFSDKKKLKSCCLVGPRKL